MWVQARRWRFPPPASPPTKYDFDGEFFIWTENLGMPFNDMVFGGTGVQAQVGAIAGTLTGSTHTVTGLPFQPDLIVFCCTNGRNQDLHFTAGGDWHFGACGPDLTQWTYGIWAQWFGSEYRGHNWSEGHILAGDGGYITVDSITSDGFTLGYTYQATELNYCAMKFDNTSCKVGMFTQPTGTGVQNITGMGFNPTAVMIGCGYLEAPTLDRVGFFNQVGTPTYSAAGLHGFASADGLDVQGYGGNSSSQEGLITAYSIPNYNLGGSYAELALEHFLHGEGASPIANNTNGNVIHLCGPWGVDAKARATYITDGFSLDWYVNNNQYHSWAGGDYGPPTNTVKNFRFGYVALEANETWSDVVGPSGAPVAAWSFSTTHYRWTEVTDFNYYDNYGWGMQSRVSPYGNVVRENHIEPHSRVGSSDTLMRGDSHSGALKQDGFYVPDLPYVVYDHIGLNRIVRF